MSALQFLLKVSDLVGRRSDFPLEFQDFTASHYTGYVVVDVAISHRWLVDYFVKLCETLRSSVFSLLGTWKRCKQGIPHKADRCISWCTHRSECGGVCALDWSGRVVVHDVQSKLLEIISSLCVRPSQSLPKVSCASASLVLSFGIVFATVYSFVPFTLHCAMLPCVVLHISRYCDSAT